jgi:hypothetical protein
MKQRNRDSERQSKSHRTAPEATACGFAYNRPHSPADPHCRRSLRLAELSLFGDLFKAGFYSYAKLA